MLSKLLTKVQGEAVKYAVNAAKNPGPVSAVTFNSGVTHGYVKALNHVEQWIEELLENEGDDEDK
jgi:hypothetical protein